MWETLCWKRLSKRGLKGEEGKEVSGIQTLQGFMNHESCDFILNMEGATAGWEQGKGVI